MQKITYLTLLLFVFCLGTRPVWALEADQYAAWHRLGLKDSTERLNVLMNERLDYFLYHKVNHKDKRAEFKCARLAIKFSKHIRPHYFMDRIKSALLEDQSVEVYPSKINLFRDYKNSIYRGFIWPFVMPVAQTIKINGVFIGSDKIDHFFSSGRKYYTVYVRSRERGEDHQTALKRAIEYGLMGVQETGALGYWSSGAFSYADLESNYQGMQMSIDLCDEKDPVLAYDSAKKLWVARKKIDMRRYVNPLWDEAYNNSFFLGGRFNGVKNSLKKEYCSAANDPQVKKLWQNYRKRFKPSFNTNYLRGLLSVGRIPDPRPQSFQTVCGLPQGQMQGPPSWEFPVNEK